MDKPFSDTAAARLLRERLRDLRGIKTQAEVAKQAGFRNANFLSILKSGGSKIPLDRVPDLARALDVDQAYLMRMALEQSIGPAAAAAVLATFGTPVSANELGWLEELRDASDHTDPRLTTKSRAAIRGIFGK
ncbi:XRE family transcriptional regulator [uncultured Paracoccus sp.]|uniref:XRE family transcriptional regulator n=1 Tax=uncultured Paracoccus sp. TaxID=189685 RepID=UPI00263640D7|nr:XRE family transcriptional regulator [uncultured Paracoccus sp.]